jgi:hypothetical protein
MGSVLPKCSGACRGPGRSIPDGAISVLLVSSSADWNRAAQDAAADAGAVGVACNARCAVARLAGMSPGISHLLVDGSDDLGLFEALADLAAEAPEAATSVLALGAPRASRPAVRVVPVAEPGPVRDALMVRPARGARASLAPEELRATLGEASVETRYQPIVRLADAVPVALEALVRLRHPGKGTIMPDSFVPQLEAAGLGAELTRLVSARALSDLARPPLAPLGLRMGLNFPLDVLLEPAAVEALEIARQEAGVAADRIVIELTESQPAQDLPRLRRALERLRGLGYGAAIDDVGPGAQDLGGLLALPFTSVKLDKAVVQAAGRSERARGFVAAVIDGAKAAGMVVVAEGVETVDGWHALRAMGADCAQGFLAARPLPLAAVPVWRDAWDRFPRPV